MRLITLAPCLLVALSWLLPGRLVHAAGLQELARDYSARKKKVGGPPDRRQKTVDEQLKPLLKQIGALDTSEALAFLMREFEDAVPEISAACAPAILQSSKPQALDAVLKGFSRRHPTAQAGVLDGLAATKLELGPASSDIIRAARSITDPGVRSHLPAVLGKLDTKESAEVLVSLVSPPGRKRRSDADDRYRREAVKALRATRNDEVKEWLAKDAFAAARSNAHQLDVVAAAAGALKLGKARSDLEKLVEHKSLEVAGTAVEALAEIGAQPSIAVLEKALRKRSGRGTLSFRVRTLDAIARSGSEEGLDVVLEFAQGKDPSMRAVAMGSLALVKSPKALEALLAGLRDEQVSVRSTALTALTGKREKAAIGALIDHLGRETEQRLKLDSLRLLVTFTGHNMGMVVEDWTKWWELEEPHFQFPDEREAKGSTDVRLVSADEVIPKYFGMEMSSKKLGFVVDVSSSMTQSVKVKGGGQARKIDILKKELANVVKQLSADTRINIILFDRDYKSWQKQLQPLAGAGRAKVLKFVGSISTGHGTNVFDSLEFALTDGTVDTIYLLTDGVPTAGRIQEPAGILREIAVLNRVRGVTIHCIAFGEESKLLESLAKENKGQYRFVNEY